MLLKSTLNHFQIHIHKTTLSYMSLNHACVMQENENHNYMFTFDSQVLFFGTSALDLVPQPYFSFSFARLSFAPKK